MREVKEDLPSPAQALKLNVQFWEVRTADDFERVFVAVHRARPDGLYVPGGGTRVNSNLKLIAARVLRSRLPSVYQSREAADAGGLMSYGADPTDNYTNTLFRTWAQHRRHGHCRFPENSAQQAVKFRILRSVFLILGSSREFFFIHRNTR